MLSCGDERYGLICHSKYTNPTVTADTRTKSMNSPPYVVPCPTPETSVRFTGIARWVFRQLISRFCMSDMTDWRRGAH